MKAIALDNESETFAEYLLPNECALLIRRNRMLIRLKLKIFFPKIKTAARALLSHRITTKHNKITQQNYYKKFLTIKLTFGADYESYISEYLMSLKASDSNKYDMLTNVKSKLMFYHFNNFLN